MIGIILLMNVNLMAQSVRTVNFEEIETRLKSNSDTTFVINFWATWCKPCVEEMPDFQRLSSETKLQKIKFIFVSLDFVNELDKVKEFIKNKEIKEETLLLKTPDQNSWIDKISKTWLGSIPATLLINNSLMKQKFIEKQLDYQQLVSELNFFK